MIQELFETIIDPIWIVTVVIVSFLVNLASSYAKPFLDKLIAKYSSRKNKQLAHNKKLEDDFYHWTLKESNHYLLVEIKYLRLLTSSGEYFIVSFICFAVSFIFFFYSNLIAMMFILFGFIFIVLSLALLKDVSRFYKIIRRYKEEQNTPELF